MKDPITQQIKNIAPKTYEDFLEYLDTVIPTGELGDKLYNEFEELPFIFRSGVYNEFLLEHKLSNETEALKLQNILTNFKKLENGK